MIIGDGSTNLTFAGTRFDDFSDIEESDVKTGSGENRTIRDGDRFVVSEGVRMTGTEWGTLKTLLLNGSSNYFYTPTVTPDYLSSTDFPMNVSIKTPQKVRHVGGGTKRYYITLRIEGTGFL